MNYNDHLILGKETFSLDEVQLRYLEFEDRSLRKKYVQYLAAAQNESEMQYFFETNPILLPGLYDLHNGPVCDVVISKLQLANEYITDFAYISVNSAEAQITLIEIESPTLNIFTASDDQFTSGFNRALQQTRDWSLWAQHNQTFLKDVFRGIYYREIFKYQHVSVKTILVAGRRKDVGRTPQREKRWAAANQQISPNEIVSYDRLLDSMVFNPRLLQNLVCRPKRCIQRITKSR